MSARRIAARTALYVLPLGARAWIPRSPSALNLRLQLRVRRVAHLALQCKEAL